jgi:hypothetical protein
MATEKEYKDHDVIGTRLDDSEHIETAREEALHHGHLSAEELEIEKKLRRKIDLRIMPVLITIYLMNYIDRCAELQYLQRVLLTVFSRNNYAAARLQGLEEDLGLTGDEYQTGLSILFVG